MYEEKVPPVYVPEIAARWPSTYWTFKSVKIKHRTHDLIDARGVVVGRLCRGKITYGPAAKLHDYVNAHYDEIRDDDLCISLTYTGTYVPINGQYFQETLMYIGNNCVQTGDSRDMHPRETSAWIHAIVYRRDDIYWAIMNLLPLPVAEEITPHVS